MRFSDEHLNTLCIEAPRLVERTRIKALPDKDDVPLLVNGDLDILKDQYLSWVKSDVIYGVQRKVVSTYTSPKGYSISFTGIKNIFRRGAKRGNREYIEVMKERIQNYNKSLPDIQFFNPKDRDHPQKTKMMLAVLTTNPKKFECRYHAWQDIGDRVNKFRANLKRFYDSEKVVIKKSKIISPSEEDKKIIAPALLMLPATTWQICLKLKKPPEEIESCLRKCDYFIPPFRQKESRTPEGPEFKNTTWELSEYGKIFVKLHSETRNIPGDVHVSRSWECFYKKALGYPHVNLIIYLKDREVECFHRIQINKKTGKKIHVWRVRDKPELAKYWPSGFIDVYAISQVKGINEDYVDDLNTENPIRDNSILSVSHMTKYITKNVRDKNTGDKTILLNALLWVMRKRSFSLSNMFFDMSSLIKSDPDLIRAVPNSNIFYPGTIKVLVQYELLGVFPSCVARCRLLHDGRPPPSCPYYRCNDGWGDCPYPRKDL